MDNILAQACQLFTNSFLDSSQKKNVSLVPKGLRLFDDDDLKPEQSKTGDCHLPLLEYDNAAASLFDGNWPY